MVRNSRSPAQQPIKSEYFAALLVCDVNSYVLARDPSEAGWCINNAEFEGVQPVNNTASLHKCDAHTFFARTGPMKAM